MKVCIKYWTMREAKIVKYVCEEKDTQVCEVAVGKLVLDEAKKNHYVKIKEVWFED